MKTMKSNELVDKTDVRSVQTNMKMMEMSV